MKHESRRRFYDHDDKFARMDTRFDAQHSLLLQHVRWSIGLGISSTLGILATQVGILIKFSEFVDKF